ncbi:MAG: glycosyltransferase family 2 protein [Anaerorhabdus sp.]
MSKVSIIVPIYNVEKYVATCLDSLLKQTFTDFEILAVNDGSPANEQTIIEDYAKKDKRIIPIQKENGGYGSVLQLAIARCESDYFLVCDPDDYLAEDALAILVEQAEKNKSDLTIGAKYYIYEGSDDQDFDPSYNTKYTTLKAEEIYQAQTEEFNDLFFVDASPHTKLYRTRVAKGIEFPKKISYTDNVLFYLSLLQAKQVVYTDRARAYYLVDRVGNSTTDLAPKVILQNVQAFTSILEQAEKIKDKPSFFYYRMFESYKYMFQMIRRINGEREEIEKILQDLYQFVRKLSPQRKQILKHYDVMNLYGKNEQRQDYLLLDKSRLLSQLSYQYSTSKLLREKYKK